ncbi:MAG: peroxide stress protein YaaA [Glaciecola sp.]
MLVVVSPAKNLDFDSQVPAFANENTTQPALIENVKELVERCKTLSPADLSSLMKISDKLAILNAERFSSFEFPFDTKNARPAMYAFNGDVYAGLDAKSLNDSQVEFAQNHLRILSGLYGVLKPLDLMQPYRLEMGTKVKVGSADNLYKYWDATITDNLNNSIAEQSDNYLVNLASNEYFSSVKKKQLNATIIDVQFKDEKNGVFKIISFYAKKARGMMARYIIENEVTSLEQLKQFDTAGYYFDDTSSSETELIFKRKQTA